MKKIVLVGMLIVLVCVLAGAAVLWWQVDGLSGQSSDAPLDMVYNPIGTRRALIEQEYPSFSAFENQTSFAGQSVEHTQVDGDYYFAYLVLGSGLPIVQGTCFRVDRAGRVFKIGEFPDPLDSYAGYPAVDPTTCKGIRPRDE